MQLLCNKKHIKGRYTVYLAVVTTRTRCAFGFCSQSTRNGIAAGVRVLTLIDRTAVALFAIFHHSVAASAKRFHL